MIFTTLLTHNWPKFTETYKFSSFEVFVGIIFWYCQNWRKFHTDRKQEKFTGTLPTLRANGTKGSQKSKLLINMALHLQNHAASYAIYNRSNMWHENHFENQLMAPRSPQIDHLPKMHPHSYKKLINWA